MDEDALVSAFREGLRLGAATASAAKPAAAVAPSPPAKTSENRTGRPIYVIFRAPTGYEGLLGLHRCRWAELSEKLPGKKLIGSAICDCKKFVEVSEAEDYFRRRAAPGTPLVHHEYGM